MDSAFPFVAALNDRATRCSKKAPVMVVHSEYSALVTLFLNRRKFNGLKSAVFTSIEDETAELKRSLIKMFEDHCGNGLLMLKFQLLYHLPKDLGRFGNINMLDASPFERCNVRIE